MLIHLKDLELTRGSFRLRLDRNWQAPVTLVQGPSGSGKSLLLRCLAGLERPDAGLLSVDDEVWAGKEQFLAPHRRPVSLVFQDYRLFPHLDVLANLRFAGAGRSEAETMAARFGLSELLPRRTPRLSGGERQRVAVLRALLRPCRLLLLDEPLSALNPELRAQWLELLEDHRRERSLSLVYVSHSEEELSFWPEAHRLNLAVPAT